MYVLSVAIYVIFISFSWGQLGRISFQNQLVNGYIYEIAMAITLCLLFFRYRLQPIKNVIKNFKWELSYFFYLIILFAFTAFQYSLNENITAFLYIVRLFLYVKFFFYLFYFVKESSQNIKVIQNGIIIFLLITIVTSILQYFFFPDLRVLFYSGWDPHLYRLFGVFFDPPITAAIYGLLIIWLLHGRNNISQAVRYGFIFVLIIGLFLTYSRGAYLAVLVTTGIMLTKMKYGKYMFIFIPVFLMVLLLLPKKFGEGVNLLRTSTIASRMVDYRQGLQLWQKYPVFGIGYNRIRSVKSADMTLLNSPSHSGASFHSSFLMILVTSGVIGCIFFIGILRRGFQLGQHMQYSIIYTSILSLTDNVLLHPFVLFLLFLFVVLNLKKINHLFDTL